MCTPPAEVIISIQVLSVLNSKPTGIGNQTYIKCLSTEKIDISLQKFYAEVKNKKKRLRTKFLSFQEALKSIERIMYTITALLLGQFFRVKQGHFVRKNFENNPSLDVLRNCIRKR